MSSIRIQRAPHLAVTRWESGGFDHNPFPGSGVPIDLTPEVTYEGHVSAQVQQINSWLESTVDAETKQWLPLALKGSIGVGKTHFLRRIQEAVEHFSEDDLVPHAGFAVATYHRLSDRGSALQLGGILMEALRCPTPGSVRDSEAEFPVLQQCFDRLSRSSPRQLRLPGMATLSHFPPTSPIRAPVAAILREANADARGALIASFRSWLAGRELPRGAMERLGVSRRIEPEGESIRAFAHICKLARRVIGLRVWVLLIDQLEDLWRSDGVTPLRRARFLTDLRTLVDEGLDGAPVAMVLGWNTDVVEGGTRRAAPIDVRFETDYLALWTRLSTKIDLPPLPEDHLAPFAE